MLCCSEEVWTEGLQVEEVTVRSETVFESLIWRFTLVIQEFNFC